MTTLHYVLIGLAILLVGGMALYNMLQERRLRRQIDQMFSGKRGEVELGSPDLPSPSAEQGPLVHLSEDASGDAPAPHDAQALEWGPGAVAAARPDADVAQAAPPAELPSRPPRIVIEPPPEFSELRPTALLDAPVPPVASVVTGGRLDPGTEYIARLRFGQGKQTALVGLLRELRALGKPVRAIGQRADGAWEELGPHPAGTYPVVELGIQLADRSGAIREAELDTFCQALYAFATEHGGAVSCPDKRAALELARELDQFCVEVDVLIGLNVVPPDSEPFRGEDVLHVAAETGLRWAEDGSYVLRDGAGRILFSMVNQEEQPFPTSGEFITYGVTLLFDVPRVADGLAVFDRMTQLGFDLAARLPGRLVDDHGRPVSQDSLRRDRRRLDELYARMYARDIPPGGERALRLFA